jgi:hypothetical protein
MSHPFEKSPRLKLFKSEPTPAQFDHYQFSQNDALRLKATAFFNLMKKEYRANWLVEGLFEQQNLGLIFGNSASGKSLIVQDLCYCVAAGIDFHGKKVKQGNVLYIAGEGQAGLQKRFHALHSKYNGYPAGLHFADQPAQLMDTDNAMAVGELVKEIGDVSLVVIDTLHRNFGNGDENSSRDFAQFLSNVDTYIKSTGAAVLIIHHSGNDVKDRSRGSSSIKAAMDVEFCVTKENDHVVMTNTKMKDFDPPAPMAFTIEKREQSVTLEPTEYVKKSGGKTISKNASKTLYALKNALDDDGLSPPRSILDLFKDSPQNAPAKVVTIETWRSYAYEAITVDSTPEKMQNSKKLAFQRARADLEKIGDIGIHGGFVWIAYAENNNHI